MENTLTDEFNKTTRLTAYLTQENLLFADAAKAIDGGGFSARLNGILQRYRAIFNVHSAMLADKFNEAELLILADAAMSSGKNGPWLADWLSYKVEIAEESGINAIDYLKSNPLLSKLSSLDVVSMSILEELVINHLITVTEQDLTGIQFKVIKSMLKDSLNNGDPHRADYLLGQINGLSRKFHKEKYGEQQMHDLMMIDDSERAKGYRDGYNLKNLPV